MAEHNKKLRDGEKQELRMIRDGFDSAFTLATIGSYIADGFVEHGPDGPRLTDAGRAALRGDK